MDIVKAIGSVARIGEFEGVLRYDRARRMIVLRNHFGHIKVGYFNSADGFSPIVDLNKVHFIP